MEKLGNRKITFRIGPIAEDRLIKAAALFGMTPTTYAKAVLYLHLGVFDEPLDKRKRCWKKRRQVIEEDFEFRPGRHTTRAEP